MKINSLQFAALFLMIIVSFYFGIEGLSIENIGGRDSYISILLACIIGIIFLVMFFYIFNFKPKLKINEKIKTLFNKNIASIINTTLIICFFTIAVTSFYNITNFITSQFLTQTPKIIIGLLFLLVIIYINFKGIEVITRVNFILVTIDVILLLISFISLLPKCNFDNFLPFLENPSNVIKGSGYIFLMNVVPMFMLLVIPKDMLNDNKYKSLIIINYIISFICILNIVIITIGNLGIDLANLYHYPEYIVLKKIHIFNFIDRIENVLEIQWIFGSFQTISFIVYYIKNSKKSNNNDIIITTFLILIFSLILFKNDTVFEFYIKNIAPSIRIIILSIFMIICVKIFLYNHTNNNTKYNNNNNDN